MKSAMYKSVSKTTASMLLLATAMWAQQVAVPQGGSLGASSRLSDAATLNADKVDNKHGSSTPMADTVPIAGPDGKLAAGWIPLPTASNLGGVFMDADCLAGNHVNGIDLATGRLKCSTDTAGDWNTIANRPLTFPPSTHTHAEAEITDLVTHLGQKAPLADPVFAGVLTAPAIVATESVQTGSGTPLVNFSYGTEAPAGSCSAGVYWQQISGVSVAEFDCVNGAWVSGGAGESTPALSEDSTTVISTKTYVGPGFSGSASSDQSVDIPTGVSLAVSASHHSKMSTVSDKLYVSENGGAYTELAKITSPPAAHTHTEADLVISDVTTANVSTNKHGFVPKLNGTASTYLNGNGGWTTPPGGTPPGSDTQVLFNDGGAFGAATGFTFAKSTNKLAIPGAQTDFKVLEGTPVVVASENHWSFNSATAHPAYSHAGGAAADVVLNSDVLTLAELPAAAKVRKCEYAWTGTGTSGVLQDTDDEAYKCYNSYGANLTVTAVRCLVDGGTTTIMPVNNSVSGHNLLSGNLTCGTSGTYANGTLTATGADLVLASGGTLSLNIVSAGGTAKEITIVIEFTL